VSGSTDALAQEEPLPASRFAVTVDGVPVAGVLRVSALQLAGSGSGTTALPVVITRAAGTDDVFDSWARSALGRGHQPARDVVLTVMDAAGSPRLGWQLVGATPVAYSPAGELDATVSGVLTETLTLAVTDIRRT
jgi:phage tail-like protein